MSRVILAYLAIIYEFRGFGFVKYFLTYILIIGPFLAAYSQGDDSEEIRTISVSFVDSVKAIIEKGHQEEYQVLAKDFETAWNSLGMDLQNTIKDQAKSLRKQTKSLKPAFFDYYAAISVAVNQEQLSSTRLVEFLTVCQQVIDRDEINKTKLFLKKSKEFFEHHTIHLDKKNKTYVICDSYKFEYRAPAEAIGSIPFDEVPSDSWDSNSESDTEDYWEDSNDSWDDTSENSAWDTRDSYEDEEVEEEILPVWMLPQPQPIVEGPVITFERGDINFVTRHDSLFLRGTKGTYSLDDHLFVGEGGKFYAEEAGLGADSVTYTLNEFNFDVRYTTLKAEQVTLDYKGRTPGPIKGRFEYTSQPRGDSVLSHYPKFESYGSDIEHGGLPSKEIKITGGFSLKGNKITTESVSGKLTTVEVSHEGDRRFIAKSSAVEVKDSIVISDNTRLRIYQLNDSIVHPRVKLKYNMKSEFLILVPAKSGTMHYTPYASSFFGIDFAVDNIYWDLKSDSLNLEIYGGRRTNPMIIESTDYYDAEDFRLLKGRGFSFHPVVLVAAYSFKIKSRDFYTGDLASHYQKDIQEIKSAMEFLAQKGLIEYDKKESSVHVKQKVLELYWSYKGESDYDNIKIHSLMDTLPNATLNYKKGYMTVRGVDEFKVSDSLYVMIIPDSSTITLLQNRGVQFDGTINAGNFEISGKGFTLSYDSFLINLTQIDSINFFVTEKNSRGQSIRRKLSNSMVGSDSTAAAANGLTSMSQSSGTLYINLPNNKSGKRKLPNYPRLDASAGGVIYFDRPEVLGGVYDRSFFFSVPPFKIDSLNDADPAAINFDGTFVSSGMFPSFKDKLHTMPDKSLGFEHAIPKPGYQLFNSPAVMNGALSMNNRGLRGGGKIDYLGATVVSPDFLFYPDSVIASGNRAVIRNEEHNSVSFPQASLPDFSMKWYPKRDQMILRNNSVPFNFYDSTAQLNGKVTISQAGVFAQGKMVTRGTELLSKDMNFKGKSFSARHAKFKVNSKDPRKPLMFGDDIRLKFNLEESYADISPEVAGVAAINFPFAQVKTSMPNARWDMKRQKILMKKDPGTSIENSYFYSTREQLDSLYFNAESAEYDMESAELKVMGIPYIIVADAKITPENNEVLILENSRIGTLENTTIVLDTLNGYHRLTNGVVDIVSRNEFAGYATYQYVNWVSDTFNIEMKDFHLEPIIDVGPSKRFQLGKGEDKQRMQTVGTGYVPEEKHMVLGAGMFYKGDLTMYASKPALQLNGYLKLDIKSIKDYDTWIKFNQSGDNAEVVIDFDNAIDDEGKSVEAGLNFHAVDNSLYITFLSEKKTFGDESFFKPSGILFFDTKSNEYKIENREKAEGTKLEGKVFAYNDQTGQIRFEGPIDIFRGPEDFKVKATAIGSGNLQSNEISMNSFMIMESNVPQQAFEAMAADLKQVIENYGADEGLGDHTELLYKVADVVGEKAARAYEEKSYTQHVSLAEIPELVKPLVISNANLKYSEGHRAFFNEGKIGFSNILRNDINGAFDGFLEIKKSEDGSSVFNLFFKASADSWYYFGFEGTRLMVYSSNSQFNSIIAKKTNAGKTKIGEVAFIPGSEDETLAFINRFRASYYGIESPYNLNADVGRPKPVSDIPGDEEETPPSNDGF